MSERSTSSSSTFDVEGMPITENADQIRRRITRLIENGGMKVGEFCQKISVSNNAYNRFTQQHGPTKGLQSDVSHECERVFQEEGDCRIEAADCG
jgi:hypothetical protein